MRRWLLIFLVLLLPMQFSWAAVASYCQHESTVSTKTQHVGHHEHQHHADADASTDSDGGKHAGTAPANTVDDLDCGTCHACCCAAVMQAPALWMAKLPSVQRSTPVLYPLSQPGSLPERPNWAALA